MKPRELGRQWLGALLLLCPLVPVTYLLWAEASSFGKLARTVSEVLYKSHIP